MYPHRIRLRGPWDWQFSAGDPSTGRITLPISWRDAGLGDFPGEVLFRRRFGYPGRIDTHERVWLTMDGVSDRATVRLNGRLLTETLDAHGGEFEITTLLQPRNELEVIVTGGKDGGLTGEVALEVRATAWLRDITIVAQGAELIIQGEVVGHAEELLEVYLVIDRYQAGYQAIATLTQPQAFAFRVPARNEDNSPRQSAKIELVRGATVWYSVEPSLRDSSP